MITEFAEMEIPTDSSDSSNDGSNIGDDLNHIKNKFVFDKEKGLRSLVVLIA